jgi:hypothetical protein
MTAAQVQQAVHTLEANGETVSARKVLRLLRRTPPYIGGSYRDLLPLLKIQRVPSAAAQALQDVIQMADACEQAVTDAAPYKVRQALIAESEKGWVRWRHIMLTAGAKGEDVGELSEAFERLRQARTRLIIEHAGREK